MGGPGRAARNVSRAFAEVLQRAGLPRIRFHDLRHSAATLMLAQGVDPRTIMETLGHSQIGTTLNIYAHVLPAMQRDAADRIGPPCSGVRTGLSVAEQRHHRTDAVEHEQPDRQGDDDHAQ
ncbi:MAG: site-specific integrase [Chloroflexota bacterium]